MENSYTDYLVEQITELRKDYLDGEFSENYYRTVLDTYLDSLANFYVMIVKNAYLA
ncbi:hypothetical protein [Clostridium botulinum]|uniref:hypothetical protein n=1 Tax=Clostridium botulinum TaxID=1491 RepID=UPI000ADD45D5|nr:hypothetical protein [Clostridium botulinum]